MVYGRTTQILRKSDLSHKIKREFFPTVAVSVNTVVWLHHLDSNETHGEKKLAGNYTRLLRAVLNKSWKQQPPKTALVRPFTSHLRDHPIKT